MNNIAIKFTLDSGDVDFYDEEKCEVLEVPDQNIIVHKSQQTASTVKIYDTQYKTWQVTIEEYNPETQANLLSIIEESDEMVFYPYYQYDSSISHNVILVPDEVRKVYAYGEREAFVRTTFNLLESSI